MEPPPLSFSRRVGGKKTSLPTNSLTLIETDVSPLDAKMITVMKDHKTVKHEHVDMSIVLNQSNDKLQSYCLEHSPTTTK